MKSAFHLIVLPIAALTLASCKTAAPTQPDRFDEADTNHDGKLSKDEVNTYFAVSVFTGRDTNHDKKMTREEWNPMKDKHEENIFIARDTNKDGVVTLEEAVIYAKKTGHYNKVV